MFMAKDKKIGKIFLIGFLISFAVYVIFHLIYSFGFNEFNLKGFLCDLVLFAFPYIGLNFILYFTYVNDHKGTVFSWSLVGGLLFICSTIFFAIKVWTVEEYLAPLSAVFPCAVSCCLWFYISK